MMNVSRKCLFTYRRSCILYKNLFHLLPQLEAQHVYNTLHQESKVQHWPSHERDPLNKQVEAIYNLATAVKQEGDTF